jgi:hypothetical protein
MFNKYKFNDNNFKYIVYKLIPVNAKYKRIQLQC